MFTLHFPASIPKNLPSSPKTGGYLESTSFSLLPSSTNAAALPLLQSPSTPHSLPLSPSLFSSHGVPLFSTISESAVGPSIAATDVSDFSRQHYQLHEKTTTTLMPLFSLSSLNLSPCSSATPIFAERPPFSSLFVTPQASTTQLKLVAGTLAGGPPAATVSRDVSLCPTWKQRPHSAHYSRWSTVAVSRVVSPAGPSRPRLTVIYFIKGIRVV
ncbi:hypothetical protein PIB30_073227 [Stylosanthes scabra]|uniref:Uncharacterized protein n=1 Tax=Stylosanthes scabra TaxID=79078 RepID=A0ABU6YN63_9FABA|nr:hypothetical protein [Stylosanthes scabra]